MKKAKLNEEGMMSELSQSKFFRPKRQEETERAVEPEPSPPPRAEERPYGRTPLRRTLARVPFEIYQDQLETLRRFSLEEKTRGEKGSMSEMVRAALDTYIIERTKGSGS